MADDDVTLMTVSELEIYRRSMFEACFPKGSHHPRERLIRDIMLLKAVSNSSVGAEAVEVARKGAAQKPRSIQVKTKPVAVGEGGDEVAVPEPPLPSYNKPYIARYTEVRAAKKAAQRASALVAAQNELETDTMALKVPGIPATKRTPAVEPATARVSAPKPPSVTEGEKPKAVRKPRAKKESQGVVKVEAVAAAAPPPAAEISNPFSRYVKQS